ncbi:MAG: crossover junction endodeoxyribonuclease RuvC [Actinomycetales bacterium]|nr:crossover junction endodeoxyribonuclease RuvC [Actinomycetales bacterium]
MSTRVLGVDPGLTRCGVGLIEQGAGRSVKLLFVDTLRSSTDLPLAARIAKLADELEQIIIDQRPNSIALERVFAQANVRTVMGTAQISGVVLLLAQRHGIPIALHTPSEVKAAVTGNGRANKSQVSSMVAKILGLQEVPKPADAADALAIAITHSWRMGIAAGAESGSSATRTTSAQEQWRAAIEASKKSK